MMIVDNITKQLKAARIDSARIDSFLLIEYVCGVTREWLLAHPEFEPNNQQAIRLSEAVIQRANHTPIAYITGTREFYGFEFAVNQHVLVPRPETEELVEYANKHTPEGSQVLELGTGSGCISISLSACRPDLNITASDISTEALRVAHQNNKNIRTSVSFVQSDLFTEISEQYAVILANLPYVPLNARRQKDITYEPEHALYSGDDGLDLYRIFLSEVSQFLADDGFCIVEFSPTQHREMQRVCKENGYTIEPITEYIYVIKCKQRS